MKYKEIFYKKYVSTQTNQLYGNLSINEARRQFIFNDGYFGDLIPEDKEANILDVGCGNGSFVFWLKELGYARASGIDISSEQITQGINMGIKDIFVSDFFDFLKKNQNMYDLIFARDVLEHLDKEEIVEFLDLIKNSLKPGGVFISQTVNAENMLWGRLRHADFTHDVAFTKLSMHQLLMVIGFENILVRPQRPVVHGVKSFFRSILWRMIELVLKIYLIVEIGSSNGAIFTQNIITRAQKAKRK